MTRLLRETDKQTSVFEYKLNFAKTSLEAVLLLFALPTIIILYTTVLRNPFLNAFADLSSGQSYKALSDCNLRLWTRTYYKFAHITTLEL